jgi:hypothetical protein
MVKITDLQKKNITSYYGKMPNQSLASMVGIKEKALIYNAHKLGLKFNRKVFSPNSKYSINHNYFNVPSYNNSYWAGFIAADGCVRKRTRNRWSLTMQLARKDRLALEELKRQLSYDGPILDKIRIPKEGDLIKTVRENSILSFNSYNIVGDLDRFWNITPCKSLTLEPPSDEIIDGLAIAYIIGLLDGDGYINYSQMKVGWLGTETLLLWVKRTLEDVLNISIPANVLKGQSNIYRFTISGSMARLVRSVLLDIPLDFRLNRKWQIVEN